MLDDESDPPEPVSRERAKELIDAAEAGTLVVAGAQEVPTIGGRDPDADLQVEVVVESYRFGDVENMAVEVADDVGNGGGD